MREMGIFTYLAHEVLKVTAIGDGSMPRVVLSLITYNVSQIRGSTYRAGAVATNLHPRAGMVVVVVAGR